MSRKRIRPRLGTGGADEHIADDVHRQYTPPPHAWQHWARRADLDRLTARQALAVALIRVGVASTPEAALRMLESPK